MRDLHPFFFSDKIDGLFWLPSIPHEYKVQFLHSCKNKQANKKKGHWDFDKDCTESMDHFEECCHFSNKMYFSP